MNQSMRIGRIAFAILFLLLPFVSPKVNAQTTVSCNGYNPWVATQVYTNETVFYDNQLYQATWYNVNMVPPSNTSNGQPWVAIGSCMLPITPATTSCENLSSWSASVAYNGGAEVMWNGYKYTATFWNQNAQPDINPNNPWHLVAACGSPASLTINSAVSPFTAFAASVSAAQSFTITGSNLSDHIVTITAPANFEISLNQSSGYSSSLQLTPQSGAVSATIYVVYSPSGVGTDNGNIVISATGVTTQQIAVSGTAQAIWIANGTYIYNANTGNVGIGTGATAPSEKLTVNGNGLFTGNLKATGIQLTTGAGLGKTLVSDADGNAVWQQGTTSGWSFNGNNNTDNSNFLGTTISQPLILRANNIEGIRINPTGSIQMGGQRVLTGHLDYKLSVDGKLVCQKIVATTNNWADTVFTEGYQPINLNDLEKYVKENKHLPEIPSEAEVLKNGVDVTEMNRLLLKKVEEMTLYVIELEKRVKSLETK